MKKSNIFINLIKYIKEKIQKLFVKNTQLLDYNYDNLEIEKVIKDNKDDEEKKRFFELYKNIKNDKVKIEQLTITDLLKLQLIMQQENIILDNKLIEEEKEIRYLEETLNNLKSENKKINTKK